MGGRSSERFAIIGHMAYIYTAGGWVVRVPPSRDVIMTDLNTAQPGRLLTYEIDTLAGAATRQMQVTVAATLVAIVSDEPLPSP